MFIERLLGPGHQASSFPQWVSFTPHSNPARQIALILGFELCDLVKVMQLERGIQPPSCVFP